MAINKVIDRNNNIIIDLSNDTVKSTDVRLGKIFHDYRGLPQVGTIPLESDILKYNFYDYNGDLVYSYTDEELDALTELPSAPDHTDKNLTFQEWNWSLEDLKGWNRTRPDRPIVGANYITTDAKTYILLNLPVGGLKIDLSLTSSYVNSIDWGDGTTNTSQSHTYGNPGVYEICIDHKENMTFSFYGNYTSSISSTDGKVYIEEIKFGNIGKISNMTKLHNLKYMNIPNTLTNFGGNALNNLSSLKAFVFPKTMAINLDYLIRDSYSLEVVSLNNYIPSIGTDFFSGCRGLKRITLPPSVKTLGSSAFSQTAIEVLYIPNSVTTINSSPYSNCPCLKSLIFEDGITANLQQVVNANNYSLKYLSIPDSVSSIRGSNCTSGFTLDLSQQTKVLTLESSLSGFSYGLKILVPLTLIDSYKNATYWSSCASCMFAV